MNGKLGYFAPSYQRLSRPYFHLPFQRPRSQAWPAHSVKCLLFVSQEALHMFVGVSNPQTPDLVYFLVVSFLELGYF